VSDDPVLTATALTGGNAEDYRQLLNEVGEAHFRQAIIALLDAFPGENADAAFRQLLKREEAAVA
jgi:hypothetical protein